MRRTIRDFEYEALAELRYRIRQFLRGSDEAAISAGLEPQQYQMLLALRTVPQNQEASIRHLAYRLALRHHSAVGMIDRLEAQGYVCRVPNPHDQRGVWVKLLPRGQRALERVVRKRLEELRGIGDALVKSIITILRRNRGRQLPGAALRVAVNERGGLSSRATGAKGVVRRKL